MNNEYNQIAKWWHKRQGIDGHFWKKYIVVPALLDMVKPIKDKNLLDLGCGNGFLSNIVEEEGAKVVGVDSSKELIKIAKSEMSNNIEFILHDITKPLPNSLPKFDYIICCMVLSDILDAERVILVATNQMNIDGHFIIVIQHPCFDVYGGSYWINYRNQDGKFVCKYRSFTKEQFKLGEKHNLVAITSYHRPLHWYMKALSKARLIISDLVEPEAVESMKLEKPLHFQRQLEIPTFLIIKASKVNPWNPDPAATSEGPPGG